MTILVTQIFVAGYQLDIAENVPMCVGQTKEIVLMTAGTNGRYSMECSQRVDVPVVTQYKPMNKCPLTKEERRDVFFRLALGIHIPPCDNDVGLGRECWLPKGHSGECVFSCRHGVFPSDCRHHNKKYVPESEFYCDRCQCTTPRLPNE